MGRDYRGKGAADKLLELLAEEVLASVRSAMLRIEISSREGIRGGGGVLLLPRLRDDRPHPGLLRDRQRLLDLRQAGDPELNRRAIPDRAPRVRRPRRSGRPSSGRLIGLPYPLIALVLFARIGRE
ncbi:MAG: hypothetical protein MZV70_22125 [Desulfobacterales bacterium]|nr:hypothetical protein [Desulfobacterales bacterium]